MLMSEDCSNIITREESRVPVYCVRSQAVQVSGDSRRLEEPFKQALPAGLTPPPPLPLTESPPL